MLSDKTQKKDYVARTIDDKIIKDGLSALSAFNSYQDRKDSYAVMGGMATQSYLPSICRRPSVDIDVLVDRPIGRGDILEFARPVLEHLQDHRYATSVRRRPLSWKVEAISPEYAETIIIEFSKINQNAFSRKEKRIGRELENARQKTVEGRREQYRVVSPEDIALPKFGRLVIILNKYPELAIDLSDYEQPLNEERIRGFVNRTRDMKKMQIDSEEDELRFHLKRFMSDAYDIQILGELAGFNKTYLNRGRVEWPEIDKSPAVRDKLLPIMPALNNEQNNRALPFDIPPTN